MSAAESRRNGKAASCEPCRKAKIRCDHKRPTCGRCERRGLTSRCYYHPAPLTKPRRTSPPPEYTDPVPPTRAFGVAGVTPSGRDPGTTSASSASYGETPSALWPLSSPDFHGRKPPVFRQPDSIEELYEQRLKVSRDLVEQVRYLKLIEQLCNEYARCAQAQLMPAPITLALVASLRAVLTAFGLDEKLHDEAAALRFAESLLKNTEKEIPVSPDLDVDGFVAMFTGENFRLETLGILFVLAARACLLGLARDDEKREDFVQAMNASGSSCLRLSRTLAADNNDVMLWLAFDRVRLTTHIEGDSSPTCYRLIGDLATYIFEFNIHRDSSTSSSHTPFWLAECRRKLFAASYQIDKFIATLLERPPRILRRYSDCKMPLDLTDAELVESMTEEQARTKVSSDGWNLNAVISPSSWHRYRYVLGSLREEILEYQYRPSNPENDIKLRELSRQCHQSMEFLPSHLRYDPSCWNSDIPASICLMLLAMHLNYLQNDFQIHRLLERFHPEAWETMLNVASEVLASVLHLGTMLNRAIFLHHDFPYIALGYALPCAAVLTTTLQNISRSGGQLSFPASISRSTLIRNLSVFVSQLESICNPGDGNYTICVQASKAISRTLDEVLEGSSFTLSVAAGPTVATAAAPRTPASAPVDDINVQAGPRSPFLGVADSSSIGDLDLLNNMDGLDGFDLSTWIKNIDWTVAGGEWSAF